MDASRLAPIRNQDWVNSGPVPSLGWNCGYCSHEVGSHTGYKVSGGPGGEWFIRICSHCNAPTFFSPAGDHWPGSLPGRAVDHLPADVAALFAEARAAVAAGVPTAAVLACRKILMHTAVEKKAEKNKSFVYYVEYLADKGYVSPDGKSWVDYIRAKSNEANHEILLMSVDEGSRLVAFVEMLLRVIYELPGLVPTLPTVAEPPTEAI